ncbi:class II fumarate hydratase [Paludibaculum fermentans]|uniref:class II fumarate hydratase n=1 Tax=Paludibaculum fermentans TaxID=1473598 RepID=UPI003EB6BA8E
MPDERMEHDEMGEVRVPAAALYGAQTQRAVENFPISGMRLGREFIRGLGLLKKASAVANARLGTLEPEIASAIGSAAKEVIAGRHDDQFVVDVFQTGSGTSTNMNANEVIAHLASAQSGREIHPNDHVNRSQSSNDVMPSALHVAAVEMLADQLAPGLLELEEGLRRKAQEFAGIVKIGRTHLQDAVPLYLGDEFGGYARQVETARERIRWAGLALLELPLGGTAVGTGLNAPREFGGVAAGLISNWTGHPFREAVNHFEAQAGREGVAMLAGALKTYAVALTKIANDLRMLASGPRCGIGEIRLPAVQPGSSIMPGKVNPVILESTLMVCAQVMGLETAVAWCCAGGQLELNAMLPLMAFDLLEMIRLLAAASRNLQERCIGGISVQQEAIARMTEQSYALATAPSPEIGHAAAAAIAQEAEQTGSSVRAVAQRRTGLSAERLNELLDLRRLAEGG